MSANPKPTAIEHVPGRSEDPDLIDSEQAAELLAVRPRWIDEACRAGYLPYYRVGKYRRFSRRELLDWLASRKRGGHLQHKVVLPREQ